jgi:hypothetical protein
MKNLIITLTYHTFYTVFIILFMGYVDTSYSDTFYDLEGWEKILFWGWIISISVPMIYYTRDKSYLVALGCLFVLGVLFSSYTVQLPIRSTFHVICATGGIILMISGFAIHFANWRKWNIFNYSVILMIIEILVMLPIGPKPGIPSHTFWIEFGMIVTPVLTLMIHEIIKKKRNEII